MRRTSRRIGTQRQGESIAGRWPAAPHRSGRADKAKDAVPTVQPRKIIYNAQVELVVEDLSTVVDDLTGLVKAHGGYVAETDVSGSAGGSGGECGRSACRSSGSTRS
ncbi:MAG: DUF4349 domain-containing protein [Singulisphaera sp.]